MSALLQCMTPNLLFPLQGGCPRRHTGQAASDPCEIEVVPTNASKDIKQLPTDVQPLRDFTPVRGAVNTWLTQLIG